MASPKGRVQSVEFYEPIFFRGLRRLSAIRGDGFMALPQNGKSSVSLSLFAFDQVEKLNCLGGPKQRFSSDFFSTDALKTYQRKSLRSKKKRKLAAGPGDGSGKPAHTIGLESPDSSRDGWSGFSLRSVSWRRNRCCPLKPLSGYWEKRAGGGSRIGRRAPRNVTPARLHSDIEPGRPNEFFHHDNKPHDLLSPYRARPSRTAARGERERPGSHPRALLHRSRCALSSRRHARKGGTAGRERRRLTEGFFAFDPFEILSRTNENDTELRDEGGILGINLEVSGARFAP